MRSRRAWRRRWSCQLIALMSCLLAALHLYLTMKRKENKKMTDWGIILERREELQTGKIKREGRMTGCGQIKRRQPKRPSWWKRQQQHSKVIFLLTTCFFLWAGPGLGGRSGSAMCRVTPPSCPWHDKHTLSLTHTYISCSWQKPA